MQMPVEQTVRCTHEPKCLFGNVQRRWVQARGNQRQCHLTQHFHLVIQSVPGSHFCDGHMLPLMLFRQDFIDHYEVAVLQETDEPP